VTVFQDLHYILKNYDKYQIKKSTQYKSKKAADMLVEIGLVGEYVEYTETDFHKSLESVYSLLAKETQKVEKNNELICEYIEIIYDTLFSQTIEERFNKEQKEQTLEKAKEALQDALETKEAIEIIFSIKATNELKVEYDEAFKKYSKLSKYWLGVSIVFGVLLFIAIACYSTKQVADKNETINEQKNRTEQTITKDGVSNIIKQTESVKTYENKHELADTLHDISPYATKFSIIALLLGLGTFCVKISLSYRRLAEEYNHKTILAKNLLMGGKALEGFLGDRDKMVEAFAIPSLLQILEDPLAKSRKDKGGNEATLIERITNKLTDATNKNEGSAK
jgi:Na+-transporting methylmalonyl-CoA/oxaloacetate decarboxylase gamma subunit